MLHQTSTAPPFHSKFSGGVGGLFQKSPHVFLPPLFKVFGGNPFPQCGNGGLFQKPPCVSLPPLPPIQSFRGVRGDFSKSPPRVSLPPSPHSKFSWGNPFPQCGNGGLFQKPLPRLPLPPHKHKQRRGQRPRRIPSEEQEIHPHRIRRADPDPRRNLQRRVADEFLQPHLGKRLA